MSRPDDCKDDSGGTHHGQTADAERRGHVPEPHDGTAAEGSGTAPSEAGPGREEVVGGTTYEPRPSVQGAGPAAAVLVLPPIKLAPIDTPASVAFVDGLLERAGDLFHFPDGFHHAAQTDDESNWLACDATTGAAVGLGRLKVLPWAPAILVGSYGVHEDHRRQGYGLAILHELEIRAKLRERLIVCAVLARNFPSMRLLLKYFGAPLYAYDDPAGRCFLFGRDEAAPFFE